MSKPEMDVLRKEREQNMISKYDNLNNNELKFKKKIPSNLKERDLDNKEDYSESSYSHRKRNSYSRNHHRRQDSRSRSRSNSYSRKRYSPKHRYSNYREDKKYSEHHHHHHRRHKHSKRHHRDNSSRRSKNIYKDEEEESMRRQILKNNSISAFLQGKSSNIFYDDNYLPLSSNPYKYLGKPGLEDNNNISLDKIDEIPISESDISKKDIELYVINLPIDLAEDQIKELLNTALISIEANDKIGNPIIKVTKGKKGNYFILEFRTANECKNAMKLNGMKILSRTLKIGQPIYSNEKNGNNTNFNGNNGVHDLFPILSSFEKEFDYKKGIDNKIINNINYNYQNIANNLISGQNILYNNGSLTSGLSEQKISQSIKEKIQPEPGSKLHVMNLPISFNENDIITLFKKFGKIRKIELLNDEETNKFNGQCYLEYEKEKSYQDAINYGTGLKLGDNFLLINRINEKDNNKLDGNKINLINQGNYKSKSSLGILASSINLRNITKQ